MSRVMLPASPPGGLMLSGGLLGGSSGGLGALIPDDAAPESDSKRVRKSGKRKRPALGVGLY